jgi:hypothetical protein
MFTCTVGVQPPKEAVQQRVYANDTNSFFIVTNKQFRLQLCYTFCLYVQNPGQP